MPRPPLFIPRQPFTSITNVAADALAKTRGSLNDVVHGEVRKIGRDGAWPMDRAWTGPELASWSHRESLWDKSIRVNFMGKLSNEHVPLPIFTMTLKPPLTKEEIERSAECHMMLLNMMRKER